MITSTRVPDNGIIGAAMLSRLLPTTDKFVGVRRRQAAKRLGPASGEASFSANRAASRDERTRLGHKPLSSMKITHTGVK